jgi:hypothetical protein
MWREHDAPQQGMRVRQDFLMNLHRASRSAALLPIALTAIHDFDQSRAKETISKETPMPHAVASDDVRLYFEEAGSGTPSLFLHEFAADHTNWEPQMRYFSRGHSCIFILRAATRPPMSRIRPRSIRTSTLLDHLGIERAAATARPAVDGGGMM